MKNIRKQLEISPGAGDHYVAVNNKKGPFTNVNMRKAFWAALDRTAMDKARGGELVTNVMTHFIFPEIPGFEEAGGLTGPKVDYNEHPTGDLAVAEKYMKLAGYPTGKYSGSTTLQIVGSTGNPAPEDAEIANQALKTLGFKTKLNLVDQSVMYAKYCGVPAEEIDVCPNVGWAADFGDPQAVLQVPFGGKNIIGVGQPQLGPVQQSENQQGDRSSGTDRRQSTPVRKPGRRSTKNWSNRPQRSRMTGTSSRTSSRKTSTASAISGTSVPGTTTTRR